jgi:hypothetical protein
MHAAPALRAGFGSVGVFSPAMWTGDILSRTCFEGSKYLAGFALITTDQVTTALRTSFRIARIACFTIGAVDVGASFG